MAKLQLYINNDQLEELVIGKSTTITTNCYVGHVDEVCVAVRNESVKEMTIEEIEKALGHKVKIVGEEK